MKVTFIEDVPDVALAGETKEVADGYGRNYLLPKKLAVLANAAAANILKARMKHVLVKRAQAEAEMKDLSKQLDGTEITIKARAGEKERLYGSVTSADIAAELGNVAGVAIDKRKIELEEPIRQLGAHEVTLKFAHDITALIKVNVEAEEEKEEKQPRAKKEEAAEAPAEGEAVVAEDSAAAVEEAEVVEAEAEVKTEEPEVKEEATAEVEAAETEAETEETAEAKAEEAEAVETKKPKARKKATKKAEKAAEEPEAGE